MKGIPSAVGVAVGLWAIAGASAAAQMRQTSYLKASNPSAYAHFGEGGTQPGHSGQTVAVSGDADTIAIGAPHDSGAGAVYVYIRGASGWTQQAYIKASNPRAGSDFGSSVALSADGSTMAVSAHWEGSGTTGVDGDQTDTSVPQAGAVYVFTRAGGTWRQQAYLKASNTGEGGEHGDGDQFGFSLALSGDGATLAVGAITEDSHASGINGSQADNSANSAGAVYVFRRTNTTWTQQAYVKAPTPAAFTAGDLFGFSVALSASGNTLAVGVYDEGGSSRAVNGPVDNARGGSGAVYVYARTERTWSTQAYLKASIAEAGDSWGVSVALSDDGNTLAVGSADEDCLATGLNPPGCAGDGAGDLSAGAVSVFVRTGAAWREQAFLKPSNAGKQDWFGVRLALSGDGSSLAVAAPNEDSRAQGLGGNQVDNSADEAGAVYLFTRRGATWSQQQFVKPASNEAFDEFGGSLALSRDGRTLVVGAKGEDGGAAGVNGNQNDNSVDEAGAAYIFAR